MLAVTFRVTFYLSLFGSSGLMQLAIRNLNYSGSIIVLSPQLHHAPKPQLINTFISALVA